MKLLTLAAHLFALPAAIAMAHAPVADSVLFDQMTYRDGRLPKIGDDVEVNAFSRPADLARSTEGADDFVVADLAGWTITSVSFVACGDGLPCLPSSFANLYVYPDASGRPAALPVCSAPNTALEFTSGGGSGDPWATGTVRADLATPCALPPGTYWIGFAFEEVSRQDHVSWWGVLVREDAPNGRPGLWRNPGNEDDQFNFPPDCPDWGSLLQCRQNQAWDTGPGSSPPGYPQNAEYAFQIEGHSGRDPGNIDLQLTATRADPNAPDACNGSASIQVTPGDRVNLCYRITNLSGTDLDVHTLSDSLQGVRFTQREQRIGLGTTWQYNETVTIGSDTQLVASWTAADHLPGYTWDDSAPAQYIDLSTSGTARIVDLAQWGEDGGTFVPLPFAFNYFDQPTELQICIANNGYLLLPWAGSGSMWCPNNGLWQTASLPTDRFPHAAIVPSWVDLSTAGVIYYDTVGDTPGQRQFVVEWHQKNRYIANAAEPGALRFEVILDEASQEISFQYASMAFADSLSPAGDYGQWASVGLQQDAERAIQYSYREPNLTDGKAVRWTPNPSHTLNATASLSFDLGAPVLTANPVSLTATAPAGNAVNVTLNLGNSGNRDLEWHLDEVPTGSSLPSPGDASGSGAALAQDEVLQVPAYGLMASTLYSDEYYYASLDLAAADQAFNILGTAPTDPVPHPEGGLFAPDFRASVFVDNDFSRQYLLGSSAAYGSMDTTTGAFTLINPFVYPDVCRFETPCFSGLAWDPSSQNLFSIGQMFDVWHETGYASRLYRMDPVSGTTTPLGQSTLNRAIAHIAIDAQGDLYGIDTISDELVALDKSTGEVSGIGPLGLDAEGMGDLAFDPSTGVLWFANINLGWPNGRIYTIDVQTGHAQFKSPVHGSSYLVSFAIAVPSGACARPGDLPWLSYADTSGTTTPGTESVVSLLLEAGSLAPGIYTANVCVESNDPAHSNHPVAVPVHFTVTTNGAGDRLFGDGFDPSAP